MNLYGIIFIYICLMGFIIWVNYDKEGFKGDPNLKKTVQGQTSKIEFQGHTYIVWSVNMGGGIIHDPDCKCKCNSNKE